MSVDVVIFAHHSFKNVVVFPSLHLRLCKLRSMLALKAVGAVAGCLIYSWVGVSVDGILRSQHTNAILVVVVSIYRVLWQVAAIAVFTVVCKRCRTTSKALGIVAGAWRNGARHIYDGHTLRWFIE